MSRQKSYYNRKRTYKRKRGQFTLVSAFLTLLIIIGSLTGHLSTFYHTFITGDNTSTVSEFTNQKPDDTNLTVTWLDVGQGNCVIAESNGEYILIDGGDGDHSSFVVSYMQKHNITDFKYVIISHYDSDHLSGVIGVLYNYHVDTLLAPAYEADTKIYRSYLNCINQMGFTPVSPKLSEHFEFGNAQFDIVCPDSYEYAGDNNNSIGLRLYDDTNSFLILGDAEKESENAMLSENVTLKSDVYMVSHHGSNGASTQKFLDAVDPAFAVISVGADNKYGHPNDKVMMRLANKNINVFRTDQNGTINAYSTKSGIQWQVEKGTTN